ncbi:MAG: glycoside hydrolase family 5 protein [Fibrobacter sp.]|nr:glycoside hydrolase family 5 protein [Fibrobacter sp.]
MGLELGGAIASDADKDPLYFVVTPGDHYTVNGPTIKPDSSFYGELIIPVRATDRYDTSEALNLVLTVTKGNRVPVIRFAVGGAYVSCDEINVALGQNVVASDPDNDSIWIEIVPGTGYSVEGTKIIPDSCGGILNVPVTVTDGKLRSTQAVMEFVIGSQPQPPEGRPLVRYGRLSVKNGHLCSKDGYPVQLKGMSSHGLQWYGMYMDRQSVEWLASDWRASVVRAAMYTDQNGYITNTKVKNRVKEIAAWAKAAGIYCIIDWHILYDNDPNEYKKEAIDFFTEMAMTYKNDSHIIYEICNEPNGSVFWKKDIRPYAEEVISAIRAYDTNNIILVGSSTWSQDVDSVALAPLSYDNIAYTLHFYAGTHGDTLMRKARVALDSGLALFVSEWGTSTSTGSGGVFPEESSVWLRFLDSTGISWCNWSLCGSGESSAALKSVADTLGGWTAAMLSVSGTFVRDRMRGDELNDSPILFPVENDTVYMGDSLVLRMRVHDADYYQSHSWKVSECPKSVSIDNSGVLSWKTDSCGLHKMTVTVKDDSGAAASVSFSVLVQEPLTVKIAQAEPFRVAAIVPSSGVLHFRFSPSVVTPYRIRVFTTDGRVVAQQSGVARPYISGGSSIPPLVTGIKTVGVYLVEFSTRGPDGKVKTTCSRIAGLQF